MNNFTGSKYNKDMDVKDIAKLIRKDIKAQFPELKTSVRIERYSMGRSIDVYVINAPFNPCNPDFDNNVFGPERKPIYTIQGSKLLENLRGIVSQYNYDNSEIQTDYFDVNFHQDIKYDYEFTEKCWAEIRGPKEPKPGPKPEYNKEMELYTIEKNGIKKLCDKKGWVTSYANLTQAKNRVKKLADRGIIASISAAHPFKIQIKGRIEPPRTPAPEVVTETNELVLTALKESYRALKRLNGDKEPTEPMNGLGYAIKALQGART